MTFEVLKKYAQKFPAQEPALKQFQNYYENRY
jgi:hypothetical protein